MPALEHQIGDRRGGMGAVRHAHQALRTVALEERHVGVQIVGCRNRVQDEVKAGGVARHLLGVLGDHHLVSAQTLGIRGFARRRRKQHGIGAHGVRKLDSHVAQTA